MNFIRIDELIDLYYYIIISFNNVIRIDLRRI